MKMKLIVLIIFVLVVCSGCYLKGEIEEIEQLAFVSNVGIDRVPDEEGILVSVRITDYEQISQPSGSNNGGETSNGFHVISAKGETFYKAIKNLQANSPQKIFFGHNKSIIFGKEFAQGSVGEVIDGIERNTEFSGSNKIFVSEISAAETLNIDFTNKEGSKTDFVNAMLEAVKNDSIVAPIMLYQFTLELKSDNTTSYAPVISYTSNESIKTDEQSNVVYQNDINLQKTAIIKDNKLIAILPEKETASLLWIKDKIEAETLVITDKTDNGEDLITIEIKNGKTKIEPQLSEEGLIVKINCKGDAYLREISYGAKILQEKEYVSKIESMVEDQLEKDLLESIDYAKDQIKTDYFGIAHTVHNQLPDYWKEISDQWDHIFQVTPFIITCNIELKDTGMINEPASTIIEEGSTK